MKKITLILLVSVSISISCFSQTFKYMDTKQFSKNAIEIIKKEAIVELLFEYEISCYEDSVLVGYKYIINEGFDRNGILVSQTYMNFYTMLSHPKYDYTIDFPPKCDYIRKEYIIEPFEYPSFEGFLEWLHIKYK